MLPRGQTASWRRGMVERLARMRGSWDRAARSPRRPGFNGSISGREGGALAAATASGSHYHRRQRLHRRRLDPSPPRRLLRPHPVPCYCSPRGPGPGNPGLPISAENLIVKPGRPRFNFRPCQPLTAKSYPPLSLLAKQWGNGVQETVDLDGHPMRAAPSPRRHRGTQVPAP